MQAKSKQEHLCLAIQTLNTKSYMNDRCKNLVTDLHRLITALYRSVNNENRPIDGKANVKNDLYHPRLLMNENSTDTINHEK